MGLRVNVDSALLEQSYLSAPSCQRRWVMFVPPPDSDLKLERQEVEGWVRAFTAWQPKAELFDSPLDFDNWILGNKPDGSPVDSEEPPEGAALVVLSHQEGDKLFFNGARKVPAVYSSDVSRYFGQNSIAILSACNAADPRSFDFLKALNAKGVGAIVASPVLLQTPVGGRFLKTLFAQMSKPQTNLQLARFEAIRALFHDPVVGPQALSFTFLGNPSASVCGPKEPAPEE